MLSVSKYDLQEYGEMIADHDRMDPYVEALRRTVGPDSVVLDLGAGLGAFAVIACRLGARRVYAVEVGGVIEVAKEVARANGCGDRIEFFRQTSDAVVLPERASVIVSDLRGAVPLYEHHLPSIIDARERLLEPGGVLIPQRDVVVAALCEQPSPRRSLADPWDENKYGLDLSCARTLARNAWRTDRLEDSRLLAEPQPWLTLDYATVAGPHAQGGAEWHVEEPGTAHGFGLWFETTLVPGVGFSNEPGSDVAAYRHAFFPFESPVEVRPGDVVTLDLRAHLVGSEYVWRWRTRFVLTSDGSRAAAAFDQSTLLGEPLTLEQLHRTAADRVPDVGEQAWIDRLVLDDLLRGCPLGEAARHLVDAFPHRFSSSEDALARAVRVADRYADATATSVPKNSFRNDDSLPGSR